MKKFIIAVAVGALALTGLSTAANATNIPGVDVEWTKDYSKTVVEFCVRADTTDDEVDNPTFQILRTKLYTSSLTAVVSVDEGAVLGGIDLNNDGDTLDEFVATYVQYENWLKTEGEGSSLTIVDATTGETVVLSLGESFTLEDFNKVRGLALTGEPCQAGPTGPAGADGANGSNGTNGVDGAAGAAGVAGPAGPAGQTVVVEKIVQVPVAAPVALPRTA
jgi:hypothetical protein